jgi:very-short-patch-repair endonuclease
MQHCNTPLPGQLPGLQLWRGDADGSTVHDKSHASKAAPWLRANGSKMSPKTPYERRYVEQVLARVPNLDWDTLSAQTKIYDQAAGKPRYIDFTIHEGDIVRIAIEVDGYDKTNTGSGMTSEEFADWSRKEQAIATAGYKVFRVANTLINREPAACARTIELVLKNERKLARRLERIPIAQRPDADEARRDFANDLLDDGERRELTTLANEHAAAIAELEARLEAETKRRETAERAHAEAHRNRAGAPAITRYLIAGLAALAVVGVMVALLLGGQDASPPPDSSVFANCAAARAAGAAPLRRGTAHYAANPNLDRDKDGVACE